MPRNHRVLVCVAEHKLAVTALYGQPVFSIWEGDRAKGNLPSRPHPPQKKKKKEQFPLSFPDQTKPSSLCRNRPLYLLSVL